MNRSVPLFAAPTCVTMLLVSAAACQAAPVVLGICTHEADKHNVEFAKYSRMLPVYQQNGVQASLVDMDGLYLRSVNEDKLVERSRPAWRRLASFPWNTSVVQLPGERHVSAPYSSADSNAP